MPCGECRWKDQTDLFVSLQATRTSPASRGMVEARHRNAAVTLTKDSPGEYQQGLPAFRRYRLADMSRSIVNSVSYVTRISHDSHFAWQAQYLVMLEDATCCSAHCK